MPMLTDLRRLLVALPLCMLVALPAAGHPKLAMAAPAADSAGAPTKRLELKFSEAMIPAMTQVTLAHMAGTVAHPIAGKLRFAPGNRSVTLLLASRLAAGTYAVEWKAVGADMHKVSGRYQFSIR